MRNIEVFGLLQIAERNFKEKLPYPLMYAVEKNISILENERKSITKGIDDVKPAEIKDLEADGKTNTEEYLTAIKKFEASEAVQSILKDESPVELYIFKRHELLESISINKEEMSFLSIISEEKKVDQ